MDHWLDPDYRRAADELPADDADWVADSPERLRRLYDASRALLSGDVARGCTIESFHYARTSVSGLRFRPAGTDAEPSSVIIYFHGGGWVVGSPETHIVPASHLAVATGLAVFSVRYRLAPEHRFPAQRDDAVATVATILGDSKDDGRPPERLILAGDSAGAAVVFWADAVLHDDLRRRVGGIVGFYGGYGLRPGPDEEPPDGEDDGLSAAAIAGYYERLGNPWADPLFVVAESARTDGPPCYLAAAGLDPLLDDSRALDARLRACGRSSELRVAEHLPHGYLHFVGRVPAAAAELHYAAQWVRDRIISETSSQLGNR